MPDNADQSDASTPNGLVLLGRIAGAQGLKGEVKVNSFTAAPEDIAAYGPLDDGKGRAFTIERFRPLKGMAVAVQFAGIYDRTAAEALKGTELYAERAKLPEPDEDEWYYTDLIGLQVISLEDEVLGEVAAVQNFGAGDLLEIKPASGNPSYLVPFTVKAVPVIDIKRGRIVIDLPDEIEGEPEGDKYS